MFTNVVIYLYIYIYIHNIIYIYIYIHNVISVYIFFCNSIILKDKAHKKAKRATRLQKLIRPIEYACQIDCRVASLEYGFDMKQVIVG